MIDDRLREDLQRRETMDSRAILTVPRTYLISVVARRRRRWVFSGCILLIGYLNVDVMTCNGMRILYGIIAIEFTRDEQRRVTDSALTTFSHIS